jgi:hypothetical protein
MPGPRASRVLPLLSLALRGASAAIAVSGALLVPSPAWASADMERARLLDQQGVRAYKEERYNDAIRFFEEAFHIGGPPSELWNIARCHLRLDDPEDAAKEIERYLGQSGLSPEDRAEATQQLHEIQHRHSTLTVASSPSGATVFVDNKRGAPAGVTPATIDLPPGSHTVYVEKPGYEPYDKSVDAKYGRALLVDTQLSRSSGGGGSNGGGLAATTASPEPEKASPAGPTGAAHPHRLILEGELGVTFPEHGSVGGAGAVVGLLGASYVVFDAHRAIVNVGIRAMLTADSWSNTVGAPAKPANCGEAIPIDESATSLSAFLTAGAAWRASTRWRLGGELGLGIATYSASAVGGDLFTPTCRPSLSPEPAMHLAGTASYSFSHELRLILSPVILQAQPAFDGTRSGPKDASGLWLRYSAAAGLAFDLF